MKHVLLKWRRHRYFPYERDFARLEVERLFGVEPLEDPDGLRVPVDMVSPDRLKRLTYFAHAIEPNGDLHVPLQRRVEATATANGDRRQSTRYSAHGLHEYKGKFNPQVVRAIGNMLGVRPGHSVCDPFCGSGTTLLEAVHIGWNAVGTDMSPLAVEIANAKITALRVGSGHLRSVADRLRDHLEPYAVAFCDEGTDSRRAGAIASKLVADLPDTEYLNRWFAKPVLAQLALARRALRGCVKTDSVRRVFSVILSDQLRNASLQDPRDLRIRRRKTPADNYPLLRWFLDSMELQVGRVVRAKEALGPFHGTQEACLGDARSVDYAGIATVPRPFDAVITSPPYATALPYIDTQRLSLVAFGYLTAGSLRQVEANLVGARELSNRQRKGLEEGIRTGSPLIPRSIRELCERMLTAASAPGNGFRRKNVPALTWRYFVDMSQVFANLASALPSGTPVALVIGVNRTTLGGTRFEVDTPTLLADIAGHLGFRITEDRSMDTYPRYDAHRRNSISAERLIVLETAT